MSDGTTLPVGTGGDTIRTIDRSLNVPAGTSKTQVIQLDVGGEGVESLVTASSPVPITGSNIEALLIQILMVLQAVNITLGAMSNNHVEPAEMPDSIF
jgi:hypothetical protein